MVEVACSNHVAPTSKLKAFRGFLFLKGFDIKNKCVKLETQGCSPWVSLILLEPSDTLPSRHLAIHGDALTSNVLFESWRCSNLEHPCSSHGQRISATKATTQDVSSVECAWMALAFDLPPAPEGSLLAVHGYRDTRPSLASAWR